MIVLIALALILFGGLLSAFITHMVGKWMEDKKDDETSVIQQPLSSAMADPMINHAVSQAVTKVPEKPSDPDDIQVSGSIPLVGSEDVHQSKTQPIPVVSGGGSPEVKVLQIQDHVLESFYRKLASSKNYTFADLNKMQFGINAMPYFESHVPYDTMEIQPDNAETPFFMIPMGQAGKTRLETNMDVGGVTSWPNQGDFVCNTTVLRFMGDPSEADVRYVLENALYEFVVSSAPLVQSPLSAFAPLNPFDPKPKVFFLTHKEFVVPGSCWVQSWIRFPRGFSGISTGRLKLKLELPGLLVRPKWMKN